MALAKGRNLTLPRLTPSMKKGLPSRVVTRLPAAFGRAFAAAAADVTGIWACCISATSEEAPSLAAKKLFGGAGDEDDFLARAGVERTPAERTRRARTSAAATDESRLRRRSICFEAFSFQFRPFFSHEPVFFQTQRSRRSRVTCERERCLFSRGERKREKGREGERKR